MFWPTIQLIHFPTLVNVPQKTVQGLTNEANIVITGLWVFYHLLASTYRQRCRKLGYVWTNLKANSESGFCFVLFFCRMTWFENKLQSIKKLITDKDVETKYIGLLPPPVLWCTMKEEWAIVFSTRKRFWAKGRFREKIDGYFYRKRGYHQEGLCKN